MTDEEALSAVLIGIVEGLTEFLPVRRSRPSLPAPHPPATMEAAKRRAKQPAEAAEARAARRFRIALRFSERAKGIDGRFRVSNMG